MSPLLDPASDCRLCPRLSDFRAHWREAEPSWSNAPVRVWSDGDSSRVGLLIVGLAPGLRGANRTGRPFTGDHAGLALYGTLAKFGLTEGKYGADPNDGLRLKRTAIVNAVRCVPPENKPVADEINQCRQFLTPAFRAFPSLKAVLPLGKIAHDSTLRALGGKPSQAPFRHAAEYDFGNLRIFPSYHCSRYNLNTGRLTLEMLDAVVEQAVRHIGA